jgi:5-amino-6-(5-phosphoribosylamino)uracil reductase/diaminohydroxyphosphoribosylaminopyrimidine deaminase/5-amino-6-(5-phosphoribosylamino)uracil reductase
VTIHYAQSLDGRIAASNGSSQWLSGEESLVLAHRLRSEHDAVLVGVGTVIADDPLLTVRLVDGPSPARVVLDSSLRIPLRSRVLADRSATTLIVATGAASEDSLAALRAAGAEPRAIAQDLTGRVELGALLVELSGAGIESVLVEGGRQVITAFLRATLVDRLVVCICPKIVGSGIEAVGDLGVERLSDALSFTESSFRPLGRDVIFDGLVARSR